MGIASLVIINQYFRSDSKWPVTDTGKKKYYFDSSNMI